jgi:hypothetical protein
VSFDENGYTDVCPGGEFQDYDLGKTLVIFNTTDDVRSATGNNRTFGPAVIAPFSQVTIDVNNAFHDGYVVARSIISTQTNQQLHGDPLSRPCQCNDHSQL